MKLLELEGRRQKRPQALGPSVNENIAVEDAARAVQREVQLWLYDRALEREESAGITPYSKRSAHRTRCSGPKDT